MRGDLAPQRERLCGPTRPWALLRVLFSARVEAVDQVGKSVRHALVYDLVVHGAQLLSETGLHVSAQLGRFSIDLFCSRRRRFHRILLSHGFSFVHCSPQIAEAGRPPVSPWFFAKPPTWPMVPPGTELFYGTGVGALQAYRTWGRNLFAQRFREGFLSTSQAVAQHLPYLRRYARALSGSQSSGDAYVAATLEALVQDPKVLDTGLSTRIALYRLFTKIWNSVSLDGKSSGGSLSQPVERHLAQIPPKPRQAFLLVALEGLSEDDAAKVLDVDAPTLRELVEESGRELAAEIATDVLIIEDETFIALDLEGLVESLGHRVLGVARTHAEAVALAKAKRPGIILADIQLADGSSGLDAVNEMLRSFEVPVIFITAYPERFLTGERPEPAFLIAKPFQPSTVSAVLSQALFFERNARRRERRAS